LSYQVFIEGPKRSGENQAVAQAISARFGLPAAVLAERLGTGRFRVKQGVDLETAKRFAADLDALGARASVASASGEVVVAAAPAPEEELELMPESPPMTAELEVPLGPAGAKTQMISDSPLPATASRSPSASSDNPFAGITAAPKSADGDNPLAGITAERAVQGDDTGLALAGHGQEQDLGALAAMDSALALESLDGGEDAAVKKAAASYAPPSDSQAFLPPDANVEAELEVEVAVALPKVSRTISAPVSAQMDAIGGADVSLGEGKVSGLGLHQRIFDALDGDGRLRFMVGLILVTALAFVPVHFYAASSENSAYTQMRNELNETQKLVEDPEEWDGLAEIRASYAEQMDKKRVRIASTSVIIWLLLGAGLGFLFFRKLPWEHLGPRIAKAPDPRIPRSSA